MAILKYVGRDSDFVIRPPYTYTNSGLIAAHAACGFSVLAAGDLEKRIKLPSGGHSEIWMQFYEWTGSIDSPSHICLYNAQGYPLMFIKRDAAGNTDVAYAPTAATGNATTGGTNLVSVATSFSTDQILRKTDIYVKLHDTTGVVEMYVDNVLKLSYTGDTIRYTVPGAGALIDNIFFASSSDSNSYAYDNYLQQTLISAILVANEDTRGLLISELTVNGAGDITEWTGSYADIDDAYNAYSSADSISVAAANQRINFSLTDINAIYNSGYTVKAVGIMGRGLVGENRDLYAYARHAGVDGSVECVGQPSFIDAFCGFVSVNPSTGLAWTVAEVNAAYFGVKT